MTSISLETIAAVTGGDLVIGENMSAAPANGMVRDSREVKPGNIFLCIPGERVDGHSFANTALRAGAACCIAQRPLENAKGPYILVPDVLTAAKALGAWYRSRLHIPVIGIVGSVGKTTAKELTAAVLSAKYKVLKTSGNLNNELGVPLTLMSIDDSHEAAVVEMGISDFGEMDRLGAMAKPDICVFTVVGHAHLEFLHDLGGVLQAKGEVFRHMPEDGLAVLNGDDEYLRGYDPGINRVLCGMDAACGVRAENIVAHGSESLEFDIATDTLRFPVRLNAFGLHIVTNALLAAAVGLRCGLTPDEIAHGLAEYRPIDGRAKVEKAGALTVINDCYNANPDSTLAALRSLATLEGGKCAILGDMKELGPDEDELHRQIGRQTAMLGIDQAIFCGPLAKAMAEGRREVAPDASTEYYATLDELLAQALPLGGGIANALVKASHSMHFERIVAALKES